MEHGTDNNTEGHFVFFEFFNVSFFFFLNTYGRVIT